MDEEGLKWITTKSGARVTIQREPEGVTWRTSPSSGMLVSVPGRTYPARWFAIRDDGLLIYGASDFRDVSEYVRKFGDSFDKGPVAFTKDGE